MDIGCKPDYNTYLTYNGKYKKYKNKNGSEIQMHSKQFDENSTHYNCTWEDMGMHDSRFIGLECTCDTDFCNKNMHLKLKKVLASTGATTSSSTCLENS